MPRYDELTSGFMVAGNASRDDIERAETALDVRFPKDLAEFFEEFDGAEGWVANAYLAMWPVGELVALNRVARISEFCPRLVVFATDGGGEGYGLDARSGSLVRVPLIGISWELAEQVGSTFHEFLDWLVEHNPLSGPRPSLDPAKAGLIVHELTPVILGGNPTDPANKAVVPLHDYVRLVAWWNERVNNARDPFPSETARQTETR
jgi:SMI1 / KNR4 family (SUKH-1)